MLLHHTFPPRVVGHASIAATPAPSDIANVNDARPASPVAKVTSDFSPSATLLSPFGLTLSLTGRFAGDESVHNPALRGVLDTSQSNTPLA